jgi:hypothetical protein
VFRVVLVLGVFAAAGCTSSVTAPTASYDNRPLDVLEFVLGETSTWPRSGDQFQHQVVQGQRVLFVKYGRPSMFEAWRWDAQYVYHDVDAALDGERAGESYRFTDGRWLPRYLREDEQWTLDLVDNRVRWFGSDCQPMVSREGMGGGGEPRFPYQVSARISGDELLLEYAPHAPNERPGAPELFRFRRGVGWYQWSKGPIVVTFDQPGGPEVAPTGCWS